MNLREFASARDGGPQEFDIEHAKEVGRDLVLRCGLTPSRMREIFGPAATPRYVGHNHVPAIARQPCPFCGKPL